jgi:hypothetical protein
VLKAGMLYSIAPDAPSSDHAATTASHRRRRTQGRTTSRHKLPSVVDPGRASQPYDQHASQTTGSRHVRAHRKSQVFDAVEDGQNRTPCR